MPKVKEIWRTVIQYPNYEVSNLGRVRAKSYNYQATSIKGKKFSRFRKSKILNGCINHWGYVCVQIRGLDRKQVKVHRLVAITFIPNPENKRVVNHINGVKTDNCIDNLEWCTDSENQVHAVNIGLMMHGENKVNATLTNIQVKEIFENISSGRSTKMQEARKHNVSFQSIRQIMVGLTWTRITGMPQQKRKR